MEEAGKQRTRGKARNWLAARVAEAGELEHLAIAHGAADDIDAFVAGLGESPAQNPLTVATIGPGCGHPRGSRRHCRCHLACPLSPSWPAENAIGNLRAVSEFLRDYLLVVLFLVLAGALVFGMLGLGSLLRPTRSQPQKYLNLRERASIPWGWAGRRATSATTCSPSCS